MADFRMMTAMVLFRFEQELASFIHEKNPSISEEISDIALAIEERERQKRPGIEIRTAEHLLAETYLEDLFQLALRMTDQSSEHELIISLKSLCSCLCLYDVRNAVCHPNRPFPQCYWYRMAAIAADPLIQKLGFVGVSACLEAALLGKLEPPPEEWLRIPEWLVPNNLPATNDFEITGLIGRPKESKDLQKFLLNPRISTLAIVAPGGLGKTALTLDVLEKACKTPEFHKVFDGVIFLSLKLEKLTASGIVKLDAPTSIREIEEHLVKIIPQVLGEDCEDISFSQIKEKFERHRLLLFIDNLETLLLDDPDEFNDFQVNLPPTWRVLVTSRVTINSATSLPLGPLADGNAKHLARIYATRRNASALVTEGISEKIVSRTRCNPLAIRLGIDAYILGSPLDSSLEAAANDVLTFSYKNLLEVISNESVSILECLFLQDPQSRIELAENLAESIDSVAAGLSELTRTSLILRNNENKEEVYSLYPAIRDILLVSPRNPNLRSTIQGRILGRREALEGNDSRQANLSRYHPDYVDHNLPAVVRNVCFETNYVVKQLYKRAKPEDAFKLIERLRRLRYEYPEMPIIMRCTARLHSRLNDSTTAIQELKAALSIDPNDLLTLQLLGREAHELRDYKTAIKCYEDARALGGWDAKVTDEHTARNCCNGYFFAVLYSGDPERILRETQNWDSDITLRDIAGAFRARAWKRSVEKSNNLEDKVLAVKKASNILDQLSKLYGYPTSFLGSFHEAIEEIVVCAAMSGFDTHKDAARLLQFVDHHITSVYKDEGEDLERVLSFATTLAAVDSQGNPFSQLEWREFVESRGGQIYVNADMEENLRQSGFTFVAVYHIPKQDSPYLFARDADQREYYIHIDAVGAPKRHLWTKLREGSILAVKAVGSGNRAARAFEAMVLNV